MFLTLVSVGQKNLLFLENGSAAFFVKKKSIKKKFKLLKLII
jgi:hypothetical protein